jgi:predicted nucleotidyltransferase
MPPGETIFLTLAGSRAHGTNRPDSDVDLRGVCVVPIADRLSLFRHFDQHDGGLPPDLAPAVSRHLGPDAPADRTECVIYDIAKFVSLCAAANPNALEILFADPRDWVVDTPRWRRLHDRRHLFLTRAIRQTFHGYAMAQLKRIRTHRAWLLSPPRAKPVREEFGLPAAVPTLNRDDQGRIDRQIADVVAGFGADGLDMPEATRIALVDRLARLHRAALGLDPAAADAEVGERMRAVAAKTLRLPPEVTAALTAERRYRAAMKQWDAYQTWKRSRNPARAALEAAHGYDTKHAAHLIRLMRMAIEALDSGELHVRRDDAAELAAIRDGAYTYEQLREVADDLQTRLDAAAAGTKLPPGIDRDAVDGLVAEIILDAPG